MPPFLGFGRRRCLGIALFVLFFFGLSWNLSRSGGDDVEEEDFADEEEYIHKPFVINSSLPSNLYNQFPSPLPPPRRSHLQIQPVPLLPQPCLSEWLTRGTMLDPSCSRAEQPRVDFVWTWLNSSDPLWLHQFNSYRGRQFVPARHYRDHGELQHSLRSVEDALSSSLEETKRGSFFVVSADWEEEQESGGWVEQRPSWLASPSKRGEGGRVVREVSHSEIFAAAGGGRESRKKFEKRMEESLPSFNSFSIEAHLHDVLSLSPTYVYMNDDFFLLAPHTPSSFHSLPFGPIIPFSFSSPTFKTPLNPNPNPEERRFWRIEPGFVGSSNKGSVSGGDESMALERSNYLIGERFGHRPRPTLLHAPKPLLAPIQHELNLIWWEKHFSKSTRRRFREDGKTKPGDYHSVWLGETFLVERAREAMLWSWIVVTMGEEGRKGRWEERERDVVRELLGLPPTVKITDPKRPSSDRSLLGIFFNGANTLNSFKSPVVTVNQTILENRHTLRLDNVRRTFEALREEGPKGNAIGWTSLDGPAPPFGASSSFCSIDLRACFGDFWPDNARQCVNEDASTIFKRLSFERPQCGDCLLSALIQASGPLGMSKLLPSQSSTFVANFPVDPPSPSPFEEESQPHMPLTESWKETDFSLRAVLGDGMWGPEVELRDWCERLIARYTASSIKDSTSLFARLRTPLEFESTLELLKTMEPKVGMVAMNDDLPDPTTGGRGEGGREDEGEETVRLLQKWMEGKCSGKGGWEV